MSLRYVARECNENELALVPSHTYQDAQESSSNKALACQPKLSQLEEVVRCYKCHGPHYTGD